MFLMEKHLFLCHERGILLNTASSETKPLIVWIKNINTAPISLIFWFPLQLTDVPEVKPSGRPGEGEVDDGLGGELQHGAFLGVGRERVGQLEVEAPAHELLAVDPVTRLPAFTATERERGGG